MRIQDLFENDTEHWETLAQTGFWGKQGAGAIIMAKSTKRFLLNHRSGDVREPYTWGVWGGAIDGREHPEEAVRREVSEEAGYDGPCELIPLLLYVDNASGFKYQNFLMIVEDEFIPELTWESEDYKWCEWGQWPSPLHYGLVNLFADPYSVQTIELNLYDDNG